MSLKLENKNKDELLELIQKQNLLIQENEQIITSQQNYIKQLQRIAFGSKSERFAKGSVDENQLSLSFEELAQKDKDIKDETVKEKISYTRKKASNHKGRNKLPEHLPVREIIINPEENINGLKKIGEERTEILEYTPGKFFKLVLIRPKYEKENQEGVLIANMPSRPIEKCLAGNALLSSILINKYVDHLPLYRQRQIFKRADIEIAPSTIDSWVQQLGDLLNPLYEAMVNTVKNDGYLQADETPTRVLDKQKKGKTHRGFYWVYHSPLKRMVVFDYQKRRNKDAPRKILNEFAGYLQTDGYKVYDQYKNKKEVTHLACWAHARRYFEKALDQDQTRAEFAMLQIQKIYAIEREISDLSADQKKAVRLEKSLPVLNNFGKWICNESKLVLPKSPIGKAFLYAINLWDSLLAYLYNGELLIDNNPIENSIRPNALGRKNYLFAGSHEGAKRTAMFYTFFGTCKMHNVDPQKWLNSVLEQIADHKVNKLYELFPQNLM
nr:IS66 family transposase [uncultured Marinifilum sp.]